MIELRKSEVGNISYDAPRFKLPFILFLQVGLELLTQRVLIQISPSAASREEITSKNDTNLIPAEQEESTGSDFEMIIAKESKKNKYQKLSLQGKITYLLDLKGELETALGKKFTAVETPIDIELKLLYKKQELKTRKAWIKESLIGSGGSFIEIFEIRDEQEESKKLTTKEKIKYYRSKLE
jgi:hypothetical protein